MHEKSSQNCIREAHLNSFNFVEISGQGLGKEIVRERRNVRGKEKKNVKKKGKGENGVYLLLRRIICVVSSCCVTEGVRDVCVFSHVLH